MMDIVDDNDNVIGQGPRDKIIKEVIAHRAVAVLVLNSNQEVFIHKRTFDKETYPGYWDAVCAGGVEAGEEYDVAAKRELSEELGIDDFELKFLFKFHDISKGFNCFVMVYICFHEGPFKLEEAEILEGRFVSIEDFKEFQKQEKVCPGSIYILNRYLKMKKK